MSPNDLWKAVYAKPFRAFRITMTDGRTYDVMHPEFLAVSVRTSRLSLPSQPGSEQPDEEIKIDNLHITQIIPLSIAQTI